MQRPNTYGGDLKLLCKVDNCCSKNVTKRWFGGPNQEPIWLSTHETNGMKIGNDKYIFSMEEDGFGLVIKNLSTADINVTYQCTYQFSASETKLLLEEDALEGRYFVCSYIANTKEDCNNTSVKTYYII